MNENVITVVGRGVIHLVPDTTRVQLTMLSLHDSYEEAYAQAKTNTEKLAKIMDEVNLDRGLPKTTRLDVDNKIVNEYDDEGDFKKIKFLGFALDHHVTIDLDMDTILLNNIVQLIGQLLKQAELNIVHTLKDSRPLHLKMVELAVKDAKEKAEIMAAACGCKLGLVKTINYSVQDLHIFSETRHIHGADEAVDCNPESLDITPDDFEVSETVTVEWYLSNNVKQDGNE